MGLLSQSVSDAVLKKAEDKLARERIKRKSSSEDAVPYGGLRVVMFENKKQHIVHCGKCLGKGILQHPCQSLLCLEIEFCAPRVW